MPTSDRMKPSRLLLVECNNMNKWVGTTMPYEMHVPPLGLMYLASSVARGAARRWKSASSNLRCSCPDDERFLSILREFQPDVVGLRSIAFFLEELQRVASLARAHSDARLMAGGPIVKAYKQRLFEEVPELEIAVQGEGERGVGRAAPWRCSRSGCRRSLPRRRPRCGERRAGTRAREIDSLPFPAYDLIDLDQYQRQLSYAYNHRRQGVLLTSRGCVYGCTYCFSHWKGIRLRSAANIFEEIAELYDRHGIRDFYIVDDIFNVDLKRSLELFDSIQAAGLKLRMYFVNGLRADIATEQFVDRAMEAGAIWFTYAVESAAEEIQRLVRKHLNLEKARAHHRLHAEPECGRQYLDHVRLSHRDP